jgi:uncharacterized membrane protein YdjX (TVP38/TMEM64 family)
MSSWKRWARRAVVVVAWGGLVVAWFGYQRHLGKGPSGTAQQLIESSRGNWWAVVAFIGVSVLRPLVLFPASIVTVAAGILFGPVGGVAAAMVGANLSALTGFFIGSRLSSPKRLANVAQFERWTERLRTNGFEAVLLMRLLFVPYDLVNYGCGWLRVRLRSFLAATVIGSLPGTVAFVLAGVSVGSLDNGIGGLNRSTLAISVGLIVLSVAVSRLLRRHGATPD